MKRFIAAAVLSAAVCGVPIPAFAQEKPQQAKAANAAAQTDVPVKIVVLFSSGVGYFEHAGTIKGDASTDLRFKTQQINDILKSLVLQDLGGGKVSSVIYPSQQPIAKLLGSFQIDISKNPSLAELLGQLRGAKVSITAGAETLSGTILGVEKKPKATEKGHIDVWQLNLLSGGTIRSVMLDDITKLELEDKALQEELSKALAALAESRDQDKKPVTINFQGQGDRLVRLGYVVESPVWKTSYRLLIGDKSSIQGWAIVENQTDNDWNNVQLSLVSGRPISFIQDLYQPLYIPRPVVVPELFASLRPQTYDAGIGGAFGRVANAPAEEAEARDRFRGAVPRRAEAKQVESATAAFDLAARDGAVMQEALAKTMDPTSSISSIASAGKVGELFEYTVGSVSLPRQRSAMIPIVTDAVEVEKLSIYNASVLSKHPLNGARLKNTTGKHLLQGPVTVLEEGTYGGDARIDNLPPGQERLLSYGVDLQIVANSSKNKEESFIQGGKIVKGVLHLNRKHAFTQEYAFENKDPEKKKTLIIEHPFRTNWKLAITEKPIETTEQLYRFKTSIEGGKQSSFVVKEEHVNWEQIAILPMDFDSLVFYSKSAEIPQKVKDALAKAVQLRQAMVDAERQVNQRKTELAQITNEQSRIRENIKTAPEKSTLKNRLLEKLNEQENQIESLFKQMDEQQKLLEKSRKELEEYLNELNVE